MFSLRVTIWILATTPHGIAKISSSLTEVCSRPFQNDENIKPVVMSATNASAYTIHNAHTVIRPELLQCYDTQNHGGSWNVKCILLVGNDFIVQS